jgi:dephospho-CoA kinase
MIKIGLTGGIGCGKTYISNQIASRGIPVYNSDIEAKRIMTSDLGVIESLEHLVGERIIVDGVLDRSVVSRFIFADKRNALAVEEIVHPQVKFDFLNWADTLGADICVIESAILIESGFAELVDFMVVVDAPLDVRIERCLKRDGVGPDKIMERIKMQMDQEKKCQKADFVIDNSGKVDIIPQIELMLEKARNVRKN